MALARITPIAAARMIVLFILHAVLCQYEVPMFSSAYRQFRTLVHSIFCLYASWVMKKAFGFDASHVLELKHSVRVCQTMVVPALKKQHEERLKERADHKAEVTRLETSLDTAAKDLAKAEGDALKNEQRWVNALQQLQIHELALKKAAPKVMTRRKHLKAARAEFVS